MRLAFDKATNDLVDIDTIKDISQFQDIIIFGAGESGSWVLNLLGDYKITPCCFCDNYEGKWGTLKNGYPVMSFYDAIKRYPNAAICVASMWFEEIIKQILKYDEDLEKRVYNLLTTMNWETMDKAVASTEKEYIEKNLDEFEKLETELEDDTSKKVLEGILNFRLTRSMDYLKEIKSNSDTYLDRDILSEAQMRAAAQACIIDGGAFDGDTIKLFIRLLGEKNVLKIHAYEASEENCIKIQKKLNEFKPHKVVVHKSALWSSSGKVMALGKNGLSCQVLAEEMKADCQNKITTECIDDLKEKISFIKLDIEGGEREALLGAAELIKKYRPLLAISAYHLQDDLLVLPTVVKSFKCGYRLYLRHYMFSSGETVLYAVPNSKN